MSRIRNTLVALTATVGLGLTMTATATPAQAAPACSSATVSCSKYWAARTNGSVAYYLKTSEHVKNLQRSLRALGYNLPATGFYGYQTKTKLRVYQGSRRLPVNGVLDARTLRALRAGSPKAGSSAGKAAKAVSFARKQLGKPYIYGANGPRGYDCSGLTSTAWRSAGKSLPRTSHAQLGGLKRVSKSNLRPGDIVGFYSGSHVGLYVGGGQVIHASRPGRPIARANVSSMPFYTAVRPA